MAQINFENYMANLNANNRAPSEESTQITLPKYFSLKNDGDEAIVRILHDSTDSFEIITTHQINLDGKYRRVSCVRNPYDPVEACPLCAANYKLQQRFYIRLIEYTRDDNGNIVATPKIWERSATYAQTIKNLIDEYGTLSDSVFKIRRSGKAGSMDTTYSILYANPSVYKPELYPKNPDIFGDYKAFGIAVLNRSFEDLQHFCNTGSFPARAAQSNSEQRPVNPEPVAAPNSTTTNASNTESNTGNVPKFSNPTAAPAPTAPWMNQQNTMQRPPRYY